ncbi:MAG: radical SAM protein [Candidatus Omnitrophota bacterium]
MPKIIKNVLLIYPPTVTEKRFYTKMVSLPLGIAYIASMLKDDYRISILDASVEGYDKEISVAEDRTFFRFGLDFDQIKQKVKELSPDCVGISCMLSLQYPSVRKICRDIKDINKGIHLLLGGPYPSYYAAEIMSRNRDVDFIIRGEGEYATRDLFSAINQGESLSEIDGLCFRKDDQFIVNPKRTFIENLDQLPFPDRGLFSLEKYNAHQPFWAIPVKGKKYTSLVTSRGCPTRCSFCYSSTYWGMQYRARSVENVISEIEELIHKYEVTNFHFVEDNLTLDRQRAKNLFKEIINRKLDISWCAPNGVCLWTLDEELIALMKQSGCYELNFGIESGSQEVLNKIIKKPLNLKEAERIIRELKKNKIFASGYFILGFPGETKEDIRKTVAFERKLNLDRSIFFSATPFAGTALYQTCKEQGYISSDYDESFNEIFSAKFNNHDMTKEELDRLIMICYGLHILKNFLSHPFRWRQLWQIWGKTLVYKFLYFLRLR